MVYCVLYSGHSNKYMAEYKNIYENITHLTDVCAYYTLIKNGFQSYFSINVSNFWCKFIFRESC